jgi:deoxycytidylate deaminase
MRVSKKDESYTHFACIEAQKSPCLHKHGCVATVNGKIISRGYNNYRTWSNDQFCTQGCSCHAEIHTLRGVWRQYCRFKVSSQLKVV